MEWKEKLRPKLLWWSLKTWKKKVTFPFFISLFSFNSRGEHKISCLFSSLNVIQLNKVTGDQESAQTNQSNSTYKVLIISHLLSLGAAQVAIKAYSEPETSKWGDIDFQICVLYLRTGHYSSPYSNEYCCLLGTCPPTFYNFGLSC